MEKEQEINTEKNQIWDSKIKLPEAADNIIFRKVLIEKAESAPKKITVFHGGAGCGKTVAMAQLAMKHKEASLWYRADVLDNHWEYFFQGLLYGMSKISEKFSETVKIAKNLSSGGWRERF